VDAAKTGLDEAKQELDRAREAFNGGDLPGAVSKATAVKDKAQQVLDSLGSAPPAAAKG
jgi:hypothetical protein